MDVYVLEMTSVLVVNLKCVQNLRGKADRVAKVTFRGELYVDLTIVSILHPTALMMLLLSIYLVRHGSVNSIYTRALFYTQTCRHKATISPSRI